MDIAPYLSETFAINEHFSFKAGARIDQSYHKYNNKLASDNALPGIGIYNAKANTISPKLNFYYHLNDKAQFYLTSGRGFHSNDTRAVVVKKGVQILPAVYGADLGTVFEPAKKFIINASIWYIYLQQEFVYSGDGGFVDFNGKTRRFGFDFSGRYQPVRLLYFDVDLNYAHARAADALKGENYVPLAPVWTSAEGVLTLIKPGSMGSCDSVILAAVLAMKIIV